MASSFQKLSAAEFPKVFQSGQDFCFWSLKLHTNFDKRLSKNGNFRLIFKQVSLCRCLHWIYTGFPADHKAGIEPHVPPINIKLFPPDKNWADQALKYR
jgi:hypothetical protein